MKAALLRLVVVLSIGFIFSTFADEPLSVTNVTRLTFDQKIGEQLSPNLAFTDDNGRSVELKECFGPGPAVVALGYYECPMLCNLVLNGLVHSLQEIKPATAPGLSVIFASVDPREGVNLAAAKKRTYLKRLGREDAAPRWHFLTGNSQSIREIAGQIGFHYAYDPVNKQFAHPSGIVVLTPQGTISKYFFGVNYPPAELAAALKEAAAGRSGKRTAPFLMLCSKFMTLTGIHSAAIMRAVRVFGGLSICGVIALVVAAGKRGKGGAP